MLLTMMAQPGRAWGQAPVNTLLWEETWGTFTSQVTPSNYNQSGTTVYNNATVTYTQSSTNTKLYNETLAGGTTPELLLYKNNTTWTISGIPTGGATGLTLTFKANYDRTVVSSESTGITIGTKSFSNKTVTYPITVDANVSTFALTFTNTNNANVRIDNISLVVTTAGGGGDLEDSDLAITDAPVALVFDMNNNSAAQTVSYTTSSTGAITISPATSDYFTLVHDTGNKTITVTPLAVTPSAQTVTINQAPDATYAAGSAEFTVSITNSAPQYTVTYKANGGTGDDVPVQYYAGDDVIVAANTFSYTGHSFTKWNTVAGGTGADYLPGATIENISADIDLYAQWEESSETVDILNLTFTGITGGSGYGNWSGKEGTSGAVYSGNSAGGSSTSNPSIQLRTSNSNSGIVSTTSGGKVTKVEVTWNSSTSSGRKLDIYGKNSAYTAATDLYGDNAGTLIGSITCGNNNPTVLTISGDYEYIGMRSNNNAIYLNEIRITWEADAPTSDPSITANNVNIAYNATEGSIEYTVNNPVSGGALTATTTAEWLTLGTVDETTVPFTCTANALHESRTATVTLTYTYGTKSTVTKDVTITQAAAPIVYTSIPALFAAATTTETNVLVTFNNWVVSGVSTNGKNIFVTDNNGKGFVIYYTSDMSGTFAAGNVLSGTAVSCTLKLYNGFAELLNVNVADLTITDGGTVTETSIDMATLAGVNTGALLHYDNLTCSVTSDKYYLSDGTTTLQVFNSLYAFEALENGKTYNITGIYQQYNTTKEILPRSADDIEEVVPTEPTITVQPATVSTPFTGAEGTLTVTYENITTIVAEVYFCDANGDEATYNWIAADINNDNNVYYFIDANDGEARTAYFKVYEQSEGIYSNLVTVIQEEYVAPTYAELPFSFDGGKADIEDTDGLSQEGLGSDYSSSPKLKFDGTGDWLLLQFQERPGTLTFNIKNNSFSGGTFTVQTSEDGVTYTDLQAYTEITGTQNEEFTNLGENVRYIKWIYTEKSNGNVGLGNIALTKYAALAASITVDTDVVNATADETEGTLTVTYENIDFDIQPEVVWYESNGTTETTEPEWMSAEINNDNNVYYMISANAGEARTAYFKVYGLDSDANDVYSDLVTINQAAASQNYNLTVEPFENLGLITFVDDQMELEGDGNIQVTSGAQVMLSVVANEGYVIETLMVNGVNHAGDISNNAYNFEMPSEDVTISATAVEYIPPVVGNYVRINDISYLTDGAKVIIAARYDEDNTDGYYAMQNTLTSGKSTGVQFTSQTSNNNEILPSSIVDDEDDYYWIVNETENGYSFTNANGDLIGYGNSGTNLVMNGNKTEWTVELGTSDQAALVGEYTGFVMKNYTTDTRACAYSNTGVFGAYATSNMTGNNAPSYNFYLDFFVQGAEPVVTPSITLSSYTITDVPAKPTTPGAAITETLTVTIANIENFDSNNLGADYCNADGSAISPKPEFIGFEFTENPSATDSYILTCTFEENNDPEARTAYFKVTYNEDEVVSQVVTATQLGYVAPVASITLDGYAINAPAAETEGTLTVTLENMTITNVDQFSIDFFHQDGSEFEPGEEKPDWVHADFTLVNNVYSMNYTVDANTEATERNAYFKVYGLDDDGTTDAYSELVTVTQAGYVVDYATLPFEWEGGPRSEFEALTGTSTYSVGDYTSETVYCMKLDATGDYIQIKTNEQPGIVTIGVKMVGGASTSHIIVKGSSDGDNFTDVEDLTISGAQNSTHTLETTNDFATTDRYVRLYFNKGSNVGVGPITIAQVDLTPSITVAPATLNLNCDGGDGELTVTHKNLADDPQLAVIFVESDGETQTTCDWIEASINANGNVAGHIDTNTGEARTAYLKVTGRDAENNLIKSNLVTFNQAAYTEPSIVFETTTLDIVAGGENRTMSFDYEGLGQNPTFSINFYESDGTTAATYPWLTAVITPEEKVDITISDNEGAARSAYFKVSGVNGEVNALSNLVTINQAAFVQLATYSLVTNVDQIVSGKHYLFVGYKGEVAYAMGYDKGNNRNAVEVTVDNNTIPETVGAYEFVINNSSEDWTIYDNNVQELNTNDTYGFLYAAGGTSNNYLKTRTTNNDDKGIWTITIDDETHVASITAKSTGRNKMRFNDGNSPLFSCYSDGQKDIYLYVKDNDNNLEYYGTEITYSGHSIPDGGSITVGAGSVMTVPNNFENNDPNALVIEDGGQLIHTTDVEATVQKGISAYSTKSGDGWYLIASPVDNYSTSTIATGTYDLFIYNEPNAYWYSSTGAAAPFNTLERGKGYLYANAANVNLNYAGTMKATNANIKVDLSYACDEYPYLKGFNLVGNPFTRNITAADMVIGDTAVTSYYDFNADRTEFVTYQTIERPIQPGQGFFIQAKGNAQQLEFNPTSSKDASDFKYISISAGDENFTDKAYIQFGYGNTLRKMTFGENTMVYVMNDDLDYAAARVEELAGTIPVHFVPIADGFYTITVETKNIENLNYMHLIDNIKNTEIDLLVEPSYTFKASESDNADRFHLVFDFNNYTGVNENYTNDNFAHQIGDEIFVSGEGTLQVFDVLGRFVTGYNVNGDKRISTAEFNTGVYIFRMVGTEVKTQKIIVR